MIIDPATIPPWLKPKWDGRIRTVTIYSTIYEYLVVSRTLEPAPRYFASFNRDANLPPFISDEVPPEWHLPMMAHEIYEAVHLARRPHRCSRALELELHLVPANRLGEYLAFRETVFDQLLHFFTRGASGGETTDEQRAMIAESLSYVRWLKSHLRAPILQPTT